MGKLPEAAFEGAQDKESIIRLFSQNRKYLTRNNPDLSIYRLHRGLKAFASFKHPNHPTSAQPTLSALSRWAAALHSVMKSVPVYLIPPIKKVLTALEHCIILPAAEGARRSASGYRKPRIRRSRANDHVKKSEQPPAITGAPSSVLAPSSDARSP